LKFTVDRLTFDSFADEGDPTRHMSYTHPDQKVVAASLFWNIFFGDKEFDDRLALIQKIAQHFGSNEATGSDVSQEEIDVTAARIFQSNQALRGANNRALCNWGLADVYAKLHQYNYRCAITGIPLTECVLTMGRVTDEDSLYEPNSTIPMMLQLNMAKGRLTSIFKNAPRLEETMLELGESDDNKIDFTIGYLKTAVKELLEY
jgi:hypothetical protein